MSAKRVLMIVPFFPPMAGGGVYRTLSFVRYLSRYGWEPTVITPRGEAYWIRDERLIERVPKSVTIVRTATWSAQSLLAWVRRSHSRDDRAQKRSSRGFGLARRLAAVLLVPDSYVGWYPAAVRSARRVLEAGEYHAIYSTSPPETSHLIGYALHRRSGLPWVADFRDPWMNLHMLPPPTPLHAAVHRRLESLVCRHASVAVTTRWHEQMLLESYPGARVARIPNGFDVEELDTVASVEPSESPLRIMHAGTLTQRRSVVPFLQGLSRFLERRRDARADMTVVFTGPREDENDRAVNTMGLGDIVEFRDSTPHAEALRAQKDSHVLLLIKHDNRRYNGMVPGKLYEYIGLARPILAIGPAGEALDLVEQLDRGETADPAQPGAIADALEKMYDRYRAGDLDRHYDLSPRPEFDRRLLTEKLASLLDHAADE